MNNSIIPSFLWQNARYRNVVDKHGDFPTFNDFAVNDGVSDQAFNLNVAISSMANKGRVNLFLPAGTYNVSGPINLGCPINLVGDPGQTIIKLSGELPTGKGILDVTSSNVEITGITIDGGSVASASYGPNLLPTDPLFVANSCVWIHGQVNNLLFDDMWIQHGTGYAFFFDARTGSIGDAVLRNSTVINHRPFIYGAPPGAVFIANYGDGTNEYYTNDIKIHGNSFQYINGNAVMSWSANTYVPHVNISVKGNDIEYVGGGIQLGNIANSAIKGNTIRASGFTGNTDYVSVPVNSASSAAIGVNGTVDLSAKAYNSTISGNVILNPAGQVMNLDGWYDSTISDNTATATDPADPTGESSIGLNGIMVNNTYATRGGRNLIIKGNNLQRLTGYGISLTNSVSCIVQGNNLQWTINDSLTPIALFCVDNTATNGGGSSMANFNFITGNYINYVMGTYGIAELLTGWNQNTENHVFGNHVEPINSSGEFQKGPSPEGFSNTWAGVSIPNTEVADGSQTFIRRQSGGLRLDNENANMGVNPAPILFEDTAHIVCQAIDPYKPGFPPQYFFGQTESFQISADNLTVNGIPSGGLILVFVGGVLVEYSF